MNPIDKVSYNGAWLLAVDIGKYPAKNWAMRNESSFKTDTVVRREITKSFYKLQAS